MNAEKVSFREPGKLQINSSASRTFRDPVGPGLFYGALAELFYRGAAYR